MKKIKIASLILVCFIFKAFSQTNSPWHRNGDNITTGDWLGTSNNEPLLLKANNNLGIKIKSNGELMFKSLDLNSSSGPNGIVFTDGQGRIFRLDFTGSNADFLMGNGTWRNLPALSSFNSSGENIYIPNTIKLGIGNSNPQEALDVSGNVKINGGLNISNLGSGTKFKPLYVDPSGNVYSGLEFEIGWLDPATGANACNPYSTPWRIGGNTIAGSGYNDITAGTCDNYDFILKANSFNRQWIKPDGTIGFGTNITSNTGGPEYKFKSGVIRLQSGNTYGGPQIVFDSNDNTTPYGEWGIEYTKALPGKDGLNFWKPFGSINSNNNFLFLADDGMVGIGTDNPSTKLTIDAWNSDGVRILSDPNKLAINVHNKTTGKSEFLVKSNGFVYAREINVLPTNLTFPDYVFEADYKKYDLLDLDYYIKQNKHLPNIPSAKEVARDGINLAEMQIKQMEKIEELFLYIIELKKENEELKAKFEELKNK